MARLSYRTWKAAFVALRNGINNHYLYRYCEKRFGQLPCMSYERGAYDMAMVERCSEKGQYKQLARYIIKRRDGALWAHVLAESNKHRRPFIDMVLLFTSIFC